MINEADKVNVQALYLDSVTNQGAEETKPAKVAPAPIVTKSAGKAQQSNVPRDANNESVGNIECLKL